MSINKNIVFFKLQGMSQRSICKYLKTGKDDDT